MNSITMFMFLQWYFFTINNMTVTNVDFGNGIIQYCSNSTSLLVLDNLNTSFSRRFIQCSMNSDIPSCRLPLPR